MLQSKLHSAIVTNAILDYEGSCGIDEDLVELAGMRPNQKIDIYNVSNGERFSTYIILSPRGSGEISLNGAAARKVSRGDKLIICAYSAYSEEELKRHEPIVVLLSDVNRKYQVLNKSGNAVAA
jgi:aspartate 1-decarboxylase